MEIGTERGIAFVITTFESLEPFKVQMTNDTLIVVEAQTDKILALLT